MSDLAELPNLRARQVDQAIAETIGYNMRRIEEGYWRGAFKLYLPNGHQALIGGRSRILLHTSEDKAWNEALGTVAAIPHWQDDLEIALQLVVKHTPGLVSFDLKYAPGVATKGEMYTCSIKRRSNGDLTRYDRYEVTEGLWFSKAALAVCMSWMEAVRGLEWRDNEWNMLSKA